MNFPLKDGGVYLTRRGEKVKVSHVARNNSFCFVGDNGISYTKYGEDFLTIRGDNDLVGEASGGVMSNKVTPEAKELALYVAEYICDELYRNGIDPWTIIDEQTVANAIEAFEGGAR